MANIIIRAVEPEDLEGWVTMMNQRSVAFNTLQIPYTPVKFWRDRFEAMTGDRLLAAEVDGQVVGTAGLHFYTRRRGHAGTIGTSVREEYQGQGVGTALVGAIVDLADNWYNLRRLELEVYTDNVAAIRLYEKFGFEIEGTLRSFAFRDGEYVDAYYMARLHSDPGLTHVEEKEIE